MLLIYFFKNPLKINNPKNHLSPEITLGKIKHSEVGVADYKRGNSKNQDKKNVTFPLDVNRNNSPHPKAYTMTASKPES